MNVRLELSRTLAHFPVEKRHGNILSRNVPHDRIGRLEQVQSTRVRDYMAAPGHANAVAIGLDADGVIPIELAQTGGRPLRA